MENADKWLHPTIFTGQYPEGWSGLTFLQWHKDNNCYHPGDDYNKGSGNDDLGQDVNCCTNGIAIHTSKSSQGYGNIVIVKHTLGYNLRRFIKDIYGIETDSLYSFYAHLKDIFVNVGDYLEAGKRLGTVGNSGTKWAHLHFEIYAPIGELATKGWRFWPSGWSPETIKKFWLPAYLFIESVKNLASYETFLGKSKEYWLQVEKDRVELLEKLGKKDTEWALKVENAGKETQQWMDESAKLQKKYDDVVRLAQINEEKLAKKITDLETECKKLKARNGELLAESAKKLEFNEAVKIVFLKISEKINKMIEGLTPKEVK